MYFVVDQTNSGDIKSHQPSKAIRQRDACLVLYLQEQSCEGEGETDGSDRTIGTDCICNLAARRMRALSGGPHRADQCESITCWRDIVCEEEAECGYTADNGRSEQKKVIHSIVGAAFIGLVVSGIRQCKQTGTHAEECYEYSRDLWKLLARAVMRSLETTDIGAQRQQIGNKLTADDGTQTSERRDNRHHKQTV